jgi:hypothetical protein
LAAIEETSPGPEEPDEFEDPELPLDPEPEPEPNGNWLDPEPEPKGEFELGLLFEALEAEIVGELFFHSAWLMPAPAATATTTAPATATTLRRRCERGLPALGSAGGAQ